MSQVTEGYLQVPLKSMGGENKNLGFSHLRKATVSGFSCSASPYHGYVQSDGLSSEEGTIGTPDDSQLKGHRLAWSVTLYVVLVLLTAYHQIE